MNNNNGSEKQNHLGRNGSKTRHLNMTILEGHLGADPQMRYLPTGTPITKFRIGTNYSWTTAAGEVKAATTWTVIEFIGKIAEIANQYLQTGSHVVVEGRLRPLQTWEHENKFVNCFIRQSERLC